MITAQQVRGMEYKIIEEIIKSEEKILIEVLTNFLNREPTIEDFKKTDIYYQSYDMDRIFYLAYNNLKLGSVKTDIDFNSGKVGIVFTPCETEAFLKPATNNGKITF